MQMVETPIGLESTSADTGVKMKSLKLLFGIELHYAATDDGLVFGATRNGNGYALAVSWGFHFQLAKITNDTNKT